MKKIYSTRVFNSNDEGFHTYRIPALLALSSGKILAFCEGRKQSSSDYGEINIVLKTSDDNGNTWSDISVVASYGNGTAGNPVPFFDSKNNRTVLLFCTNTKEGGEHLIKKGKAPRDVYVTYSYDEGKTWTEKRKITKSVKLPLWGWYATGPCHGLVTKTGRMIAPCNHNIIGEDLTCSHIIYSDDYGNTWHLGGITEPGTNESTITQLDGTLYLNSRLHPKKLPRYRRVCLSSDNGMTWHNSKLDKSLPDCCCQASVISTGEYLLFSNPSSKSKRENMTVKLSEDYGKTWSDSLKLHNGFSAYSDLVVLPDRKIGCLYERDTKQRKQYGAIEFDIVKY